MGTMTVISNQTLFSPLTGTGGSGGSLAATGGITPNRALVLKDFAVRVGGLAGGESVSVTVQLEGVDTAVTCTVIAPASSCSSAATLGLPAKSLVGIKVITSVLGANRIPSWSWTFIAG